MKVSFNQEYIKQWITRIVSCIWNIFVFVEKQQLALIIEWDNAADFLAKHKGPAQPVWFVQLWPDQVLGFTSLLKKIIAP